VSLLLLLRPSPSVLATEDGFALLTEDGRAIALEGSRLADEQVDAALLALVLVALLVAMRSGQLDDLARLTRWAYEAGKESFSEDLQYWAALAWVVTMVRGQWPKDEG
jgi:hypothetical protein